MIVTLDNLSESPFTDHFNHLEAIIYLISRDNPIIPLRIIKAVVDKAFKFGGLVLLSIMSQIPNLIKFANFGDFVEIEVVFGAGHRFY